MNIANNHGPRETLTYDKGILRDNFGADAKVHLELGRALPGESTEAFVSRTRPRVSVIVGRNLRLVAGNEIGLSVVPERGASPEPLATTRVLISFPPTPRLREGHILDVPTLSEPLPRGPVNMHSVQLRFPDSTVKVFEAKTTVDPEQARASARENVKVTESFVTRLNRWMETERVEAVFRVDRVCDFACSLMITCTDDALTRFRAEFAADIQHVTYTSPGEL